MIFMLEKHNNNMRKWMFLAVLLAFVCVPALADSNTCLNANLSNHVIYKINSTGNVLADVIWNETCALGCTNITGNCNIIDPLSSSLGGIFLLIVAAIFIAAAIKSSAGIVFRGLNVEFLQPLFFTFAFMMVLAAFTVIVSGSQTSSAIYTIFQASYSTTTWVFIFFISFMVISFIVNLLENRLKEAKGGKRK